MNEHLGAHKLELEVTDFGPIAKAELDLRPLTVFVGASNTGKSYLAILIYAFHRYFSETVRSPHRRYRRRYRKPSAESGTGSARKAMDALAETLKKLTPEDKLTDLLPPEVWSFIRSRLDAFSRGEAIGNEIIRCFGIDDLEALVRKGCGPATVVIRRHFSEQSKPAVLRLVLKSRGAEFRTKIPEGTAIQIDEEDDLEEHVVESTNEPADSFAWRLIEIVGDSDLRQITGPLHFPAFYLPADRTGIMHAHRAVVSAVIGSASMTGLRPTTRTPMLSGVLTDFLRQLIELDHPQDARQESSRQLDKQIEQSMLGGSVKVDQSELIGYPRFTFHPDGWKDALPLMNASSMVSELAPVVLYLRHLVGRDNVLIIEEPESHLHPAMQVEFTRQLAMMVRSGIRLIVTTHSEWVLEELANTVQRSALPVDRRQEVAGTDVALHPGDVGAWLFQQDYGTPSGSLVKEVKLDEEIGVYPTDYDAVSEALYNENVKIFNRIQGSNAE